MFKKDEKSNIVTCKRPGFNTFGASVNKINISVFDKSDTIGDYAKQKLDQFVSKLGKEEKESIINSVEKEFGDSVEKILSIKKLQDSNI